MTTSPSGKALYRLAWIFYLVMALLGGAWLAWSARGFSASLFVRDGRVFVDAVAGIACGLALLGLWWLARHQLPDGPRLEQHFASLLQGIEPAEAIALAALSSFAEELFFRGAVQSAWGLLPATILFAILHTGPSPALRLWTLFAAIAGLAFGLLAAWRGTLLPPIAAHFVVNAVNLVRLSRAERRAADDPFGGQPSRE